MNTAKILHSNKVRDIIQIDENLCNGCGLCVTGCAEGALAIIDGKAKLVSEHYCDGLGACLAECPTGALTIVKRSAPEFDEEAAMTHVAQQNQKVSACPGTQVKKLAPLQYKGANETGQDEQPKGLPSWPIQLKLVPPKAPFLDSPVITLASDCSAFAGGAAFHNTFLSEGYPLIIACPKLDDVDAYVEKMAEIIAEHPQIREIRVPMMTVPCCGGLGYIATMAAKKAGRANDITLRNWFISPEGEIEENNN